MVLIRSPFSQKYEGKASETVVLCTGWSLLKVVFTRVVSTQSGPYSGWPLLRVCRRCKNLLQFQQALRLQRFHQLLRLSAELRFILCLCETHTQALHTDRKSLQMSSHLVKTHVSILQVRSWTTFLDITANSKCNQAKNNNNKTIWIFTFHLTTTDRSIPFSTKEPSSTMHCVDSAEARTIFKITNTCLIQFYSIQSLIDCYSIHTISYMSDSMLQYTISYMSGSLLQYTISYMSDSLLQYTISHVL